MRLPSARRRRHSSLGSSPYSDSRSSRRRRYSDSEGRINEKVTEYIVKQIMKVNNKKSKSDVLGYERFVWRKKIERDVSMGVPLEEFSPKAERKRLRKLKAESLKVKKEKEVRAIEKAQHEEKMALLALERSQAEFQDCEEKEAKFHFDQSRIGSEIRLREGRPKPIDFLIKHLDPADESQIKINKPCMVFKALSVKEMEELQNDIKIQLDFDRATRTHVKYWKALLVVSQWELSEAKKKDALNRDEKLPPERGLHREIEPNVKKFLQGKPYCRLKALQSEIESDIRSGNAKEVEFWEAVLKRLPVYKAKAYLKEIHSESSDGECMKIEEAAQQLDHDVEVGSYSPQLLHGGEDAIEPEVDRAILERKRIAVKEMLIEEGDDVFASNHEINLGSQVYWWHDKYRPRKPKYFNRVHTGYEWNKYNQTHYDHDNPPPKTVQGYKFNIFYPDLVEKSAPSYTVERDGDSGESCVIKFHSGPPYQDVAFRIVNKEWELSHKKGFKCTFEGGILHLYFNVKRYRYRR